MYGEGEAPHVQSKLKDKWTISSVWEGAIKIYYIVKWLFIGYRSIMDAMKSFAQDSPLMVKQKGQDQCNIDIEVKILNISKYIYISQVFQTSIIIL